eukprot:3407642-Amphidinium_carterae.1
MFGHSTGLASDTVRLIASAANAYSSRVAVQYWAACVPLPKHVNPGMQLQQQSSSFCTLLFALGKPNQTLYMKA